MSLNEKELADKVEKAAARGVLKGIWLTNILPSAVVCLVVVIGLAIVYAKVNNKIDQFKSFDSPAEQHDMVLDDDGLLGYTAADFADAILGKESQLKKLEVYSVEVSDVAKITDTGLANWSVFTKVQLITYNGYATYTVDLSELKKSDISLDKDTNTVTLKIPHAELEPINIPTNEIEFGDTQKGVLAWGDIKITPEQSSQIQSEAENKMLKKLDEQDAISKADRFAVLSVWEVYQPIVKSVAPDYVLEVIIE